MLLVVKQRQKRMRTLIKKQALDTRTRFHGAGDRGRTGTVSLPSDFESDTSANSITPAHNIMIIAHFFILSSKLQVNSAFTGLYIFNIKHI